MNLETVFHENERIKTEDLVLDSLNWLKKNGYDHYTYNYTEKKAPVNLVEVLKVNNFLDGNELLTLFGHVENLNKNISKYLETKSTSIRPQSLLLPINSMALARNESTKNRWSCRIRSPQYDTDRYDVIGNCSSTHHGSSNHSGEISHTDTDKSPPPIPVSHIDTEAQLGTQCSNQHVDLLPVKKTGTTHKCKVLKSPTNLSRKSKLIGCTKHNSLTTVIEQHANDDYSEETNHNRDNNKHFFPLNSSDSDNSSLFSIFSEPSSTHSSLYSPHSRQRNLRNTGKMSFNTISSTVPEISVGLTISDVPSIVDVTRIEDHDEDFFLKPGSKGNTLGVSDPSQSSGSNRRSFASWGYDFDLGTGSEDLSNDSIDMGEAGRINFRTGSFMTRYRRNSKLSSNQMSTKPGVRSPTQQCTNWALCQDDNSHSGTENVEDELNPILDNLMSDMDSLDSFRHSMYNRKSIDLTDNFHNKKVSSLRRDCKHMHLDIEDSSILNQKIEDLIHSEKADPGSLNQSEIQTALSGNENQNKKLNKKSASTRKRNHPFRWSSLARSNQPDESSRDTELSHFSLGQFLILKKLAMLKLTSVLEKYIPSQRSQFNWKFPKLLSTKMKPFDPTAEVFGVPLSDWQSKIGQPLPPVIYHALKYVRQIGPEADGIFRRAGGKARINELKKEIEKNPDLMDFSNWQPYDVADMIKSFFRSLPECLITNKFSTTLISIITYIPEQQWLETIQWGIINLPDENRLVLQSLLYFLSDLAKHADKTKMTSINLAVCLSPSLFHSPHSMGSSAVSPMRMRKNNQGPDPRDLASQKSTHICLKFMIDHAACLFRISEETINKAHIQLEFDKSISIGKLFHGSNDWYRWIREKVDNIMSEYHHKFKNWTSMRKDIFKHHQDKNHLCQGFEVYYKKNLSVSDKTSDNTIGTWRISADLDASVTAIIDKILYKRHEWDPEIRSFLIKREISDSVDICHMESISNPPQLNRDTTLIRGCQRNIEGHINIIVSHSIEDQKPTFDKRYPLTTKSQNVPDRPVQNITANVIQEDVIVESLSSSQKSRINWLSRVDLRGLSSDWYFRQWSHVLIRRLIYLKLSLQ